MKFSPFTLLLFVTAFSFIAAFTLPQTGRPINSYIDKVDRRSTNLLAAKEVTGEELELEFQDWSKPMLLDVYAKWCGPCQLLIPELDKLSDKMGDRLRIVKLDSDAYPQISNAFRVRGLPTLMFLKDGELKARIEGALPAEELEKIVDHHLFDGPAPELQGAIEEIDY
mmetsp:Transcript_38156/g.50266  ORF Transcript_38156/g.50266 Transcript_38156/m.50266 type:complete len:168 (+) Transcript_38156:248-751(+)|eukprot:CAMPEP_0117758368 /NCGR_PEP_ID=MMETSP0947-20121206/15335_1 /TAXON_ID=44440 /ORGANISM="Chattonella subsalsa, Strain CCMP2191" /LENGTH=167 /DNA_ID=CAMNT_0005578539 /DNA_START=203 /DNA_END=706 /DNA_ORIENTATION=-